MRCYLALYDKPPASDSDADEAAAMAGMSAEERKKYKLKKKKVGGEGTIPRKKKLVGGEEGVDGVRWGGRSRSPREKLLFPLSI